MDGHEHIWRDDWEDSGYTHQSCVCGSFRYAESLNHTNDGGSR